MKIFSLIIFIFLNISLSNNLNIIDKNIIAKVPEASGICYSTISSSLFIANDEGIIYEISKSGKILRDKKIGDYDLEGVACDNDRGLLLFAVEGEDSILVVSQKRLKIKKKISIKRKFKGIKVLKKDKKHGLEAITIVDGNIFLSNQSFNSYPKDDSSVVFQIDNIKTKKAKIVKIINHGYFDIAALTYHNKKLYMISDDKNILIIYDLKDERTIDIIQLPKFAQEGICFDDSNMLYIADDNGRILKFSASTLLNLN